jgi:hypothetical protein
MPPVNSRQSLIHGSGDDGVGRENLHDEAGNDFPQDGDSSSTDPVDTLDRGLNTATLGDECRALVHRHPPEPRTSPNATHPRRKA